MGRAKPQIVLALAVLLGPTPAAAQQFGQWSWEAGLSATKRSYRNLLGDQRGSGQDERDLGLLLAIEGFVIHPAIARFRAGLDASLSSYSGPRGVDTHRFGLSANASLLPYGAYPLMLYVNRQTYSYAGVTEQEPLTLLGSPDTSTGLGGRLRLRTGTLRGTLLGFDRASVGYRDLGARPSVTESAFLDWAGSSARFQRHLRLDQRAQDFGLVGFTMRDLNGSYDQSGQLNPSWRWEMSAFGFHRNLDYASSSSSFDNLRTRQGLVRRTTRGDQLDFRYEGGLTRGQGPAFQTHSLTARYQRRAGKGWTLSPFGGYGLQLGDARAVHSPQLGLATTWNGRLRSFDLTLTNGVSYVLLVRGGAGASGTDTTLGLDLAVAAGHGEETGLREEVELSWVRSRLRVAGEALPELPNLGVSLAGTGTEDALRGRVTLRRRVRGVSLYAFGDGTWREPSGTLTRVGQSLQTLTTTLQITGSRVTLAGNLGESRVLDGGDQSARSRAASLSFRPLRLLSLTASYRADTRRQALAPDVDGERLEGGVDLRVGAFVVNAHAFRTAERSTAAERRNSGYTLSISRQLSGWLPIVTAPIGGGEIR